MLPDGYAPAMLDEVALDRALGAWFRASGRVLDVREATTPWQVLVAEVMSQQTQIARVGPYWRRFVERWPTPAALAGASTRDVLAAWAGLGYNRRPLALRDAARRIVADGGGEVPRDLTALEALPGVGQYTARAVAVAAFGQSVAPVDVNVRRVVGRLSGSGGAGAGVAADVQTEADRLISRDHPAAWVHAVMDLAATICTRRAPACGACPVAEQCASRGTPGEAPSRRAGVPAFESSNRWLRGRILGRLRDAEPGTWVSFAAPLGRHGVDAVRAALGDLTVEGFLERDGDRVRLPVD
jgi:A/G-specific adenine glycosylase